ncbi:endonuclease/exonuclease/phosphatase family protein [Sphingomonas crocodyli]|uniref:Endonuclease/exonuclease/phosphatase domain-containing protein n=1 Tax=Sphingomonas crocodyli TaxID=1979270 RepID=A0A437LXV5_9SPHN|nr:endonuclease/exonuclease/phosphatase family protein [Sphingomonas crocodyli]RVT90156.1 hypothetical protein EOD43_17780 [Sphingomonas crocodyli]
MGDRVISSRPAKRITVRARRYRIIATVALFSLAAALQLGRVSSLADFPNNFAPLIAISCVVGVLIAVIVERRLTLLVASGMVSALSALCQTLPEFVRSPPIFTSRPATVRLVSLNMYKQNASPLAVAQWIISQRADIVILLEASGLSADARNLLSAYFPYGFDCSNNGRCSTILLSRSAPLSGGGLARADPEDRKGVSAVWGKFRDEHGPFTVVGVHMQRPPPMGDQATAINDIAAFLDTVPRRRAIVAGDFNLTPWTFAMRRQDHILNLPRLTRTNPTWPAPLPLLPIDQVYAGSGWQPVQLLRGPSLGSDHYAVITDLAAAEGPER